MEFIATCAAGFEGLLAGELRALGASQVRPLHGQVNFAGPLVDAYRACLWSRLASRVICVLKRVGAKDADELYEGVSSIAWEDQIRREHSLAVSAHGTCAALHNTRYTALLVKDAIADRLAMSRGDRLLTNPHTPDLRVIVRLTHGKALVGIDLAGQPLFLRDKNTALRPDYAAAMLASGKWYRRIRHSFPNLVALGAGAQTLVDEARAQLSDRAPGLLRARYGFEGWLGHDEDVWSALLDEADERAELGAKGGDGATLWSFETGELPARLHGACALVTADLSWLFADDRAATEHEYERMDTLWEVLGGGSTLVTLARIGVAGTAGGTGEATQTETFSSLKVYIGGDEGLICRFGLSCTTQDSNPKKAPWQPCREADKPCASDFATTTKLTLKKGTKLPVILSQSEQFARRLEKVWRLRRKWARREGISCFRVYDADLPDYACAIDYFLPSKLVDERVYGGTGGGPWLVISEYAPPADVDPLLANKRLLDTVTICASALNVLPTDIFLRIRSRGRSDSRYNELPKDLKHLLTQNIRPDLQNYKGHLGLPAGAHLVDEAGMSFEVNFASGLDVGLFLDTRKIRAQLRELAKAASPSSRFLNLFAYTGSASCYAACGGMRYSTTVDLSQTYLSWAKRNMARNGFRSPNHTYVHSDALAWISDQRHTRNRFDLIYLDPPSFSNSSSMRAASFDIQRDHCELLIGVSRLLTKGGICLTCCNLRNFTPDIDKLSRAGVSLEDITADTIPADFSRNPKIHHAYLLRRTH